MVRMDHGQGKGRGVLMRRGTEPRRGEARQSASMLEVRWSPLGMRCRVQALHALRVDTRIRGRTCSVSHSTQKVERVFVWYADDDILLPENVDGVPIELPKECVSLNKRPVPC